MFKNKILGILLLLTVIISMNTYSLADSTASWNSMKSVESDTNPERILNFKSIIEVNANGKLHVTETITVLCRGEKIKRGIYRDLINVKHEKYGLKKVYSYKVLSIKRDGVPDKYSTKNENGNFRIYIGDSGYYLPINNYYTYEIIYETDKQLLMHQNKAELYWNVTGNNWDFPIEKAEALILLPDNKIISNEAYTGSLNSIDKNYTSKISSNKVYYSTTESLPSGAGLTIKLIFPNDSILYPTAQETKNDIVVANMGLSILTGGTLLVFLYYLLIWFMVGRDPKKGKITTSIEPPSDLSAAALRFISQMGFDNQVVSAAILSLAVKGKIKIIDDDSDITLQKISNDESSLTTDEYKLLNDLFIEGDMLRFNRSNRYIILEAVSKLKSRLSKNYEKVYFFSNIGYFIVGLLISVAVLVFYIVMDSSTGMDVSSFMLIWLMFWSIGVIALIMAVIKSWKNAKLPGVKGFAGVGGAIFLTLFSIPFIAAEIIVLIFYMVQGSILILLISLFLAALNPLFYKLLKAPTQNGRKLMDQIEGYKNYLIMKDQHSILKANADLTEKLYEKNLPYAVALGLDNTWSDNYFDLSSTSSTRPSQSHYHPAWFTSSNMNTISAATLMASFSIALNSAIASSTTSSSSSGSSGGGGGGGGGGGW